MEENAEDEEVTDPDRDQVFLENYIHEYVDNLLYEVGCMLIDDIADQVMAEDEDVEDKDATRYELHSEKRRDKNDTSAAGGSDDVPNPSPVEDQRDNQNKVLYEVPVDVPMASQDLVPHHADTTNVSGGTKEISQNPNVPKMIRLLPRPNLLKESVP